MENKKCMDWKFGFLFIYIMISIIFTFVSLILSWPDAEIISGKKIYKSFMEIDINFEQIMIWITFLTGAMGSILHAIMSISKRTGDESFEIIWFWWYILKPFVGGLMGVLIYIVIRGGILTGTASADSLNIYGICGMSGLAGLFSEQANKKLKEVFDTVFKVESK